MAKKVANKSKSPETDGVYALKILLYFILGLIWVQVNGHSVVPLGFLLGLVFASRDHFRIDRKIEYLTLLIAALIGLTGHGIYLSFT